MLKNIAFCFVFLGISALLGVNSIKAQAQTKSFTSSNTWTVPAGVYSITVECWGGGGAGGKCTSNYEACGGGGGGAYAKSFCKVNPNSQLTITVGSGGASGGSGGASSVSINNIALVTAGGGTGVNNATAGGGAGGTGSYNSDYLVTGTTPLIYSGGKGGNGKISWSGSLGLIFDYSRGGGGGGAAGEDGDGNHGKDGSNSDNLGGIGSGTISGNGGRGGYDDVTNDGAAGNKYGGGGGGARTRAGGSNNGGAGYQGYVRITYTQISVTAKNDYGVFKVDAPTTVSINPLANDVLSNVTLSNLVVSTNPAHGTVVKSGNNFIYTPSPTSPQSDSFTYTVTAGGISKTATVYILALNTNADNYTVCPGDQISLEADANAHFTYRWYNAASDGSLLYTGNPYLFTKSGSATQTVYLQAVGGGQNVGSRLAVHIDGNSFCGSTSDQNCTGSTVIFSEDFSGNATTDPVNAVDTALLHGGSSELHFAPNPGLGSYGLVKTWSVPGQTWPLVPNFDHTYVNDTTRGYYMALDPGSGMKGKVIYSAPIRNLCDNTELNLSFWASNINSYMADLPGFYMQVMDSATQEVLVQSGIYTLPLTPDGQVWKQFGVSFTTTSATTYYFRLILQID